MDTQPDTRLRVVLDASSALNGIDRAKLALIPAQLRADLGGMVARWRLQRGLSDEPASASDLASMILSLEGIGQVIIDAHTKGAGMLMSTTEPGDPVLGIAPRRTFRAVTPVTRQEAPDAAQEQLDVGEGEGTAEGRDQARRPD